MEVFTSLYAHISNHFGFSKVHSPVESSDMAHNHRNDTLSMFICCITFICEGQFGWILNP